MMEKELVEILNKQFDVPFNDFASLQNLETALSIQINDLIKNDFQKLIHILYKVDVNELALKKLLKDNKGEDAALLIAGLIIERELQKIKTRKEFGKKNNTNEF